MLQRVALGQVRFNLPGLTVDARGVVGGKQLAVRFAAMDRLVAFFRALAAEQSLDDLQPGLRIVYARGTAGTREAVVFLPASTSSSQLGDVVARAARLGGGQCFTGAGKQDLAVALDAARVVPGREPFGAGPPRKREQLGEAGGADVPTREDDADRAAVRVDLSVEERGDADRAARLRDELHAVEEEDHGLDDLLAILRTRGNVAWRHPAAYATALESLHDRQRRRPVCRGVTHEYVVSHLT